MVVCIVGQLKNVGAKYFLVFSSIAILCSILVHDRVCVRGDILVGVKSDQTRRADVGIDVV